MWFSHLRYAALASRRLGAGLDPLALAWGAICCDLDEQVVGFTAAALGRFLGALEGAG